MIGDKRRVAAPMGLARFGGIGIGCVLLAAWTEMVPAQQNAGRAIEPIIHKLVTGESDTVSFADLDAVNSSILAMTRNEVERIFGVAQAFLHYDADRLFRYYGSLPEPEGWEPLRLGPIAITYSQYDAVLGKVYHQNAMGDSAPSDRAGSRLSKDPAIRSRQTWRAKYARVKTGMSREEVERILGSPQACDRILVEPYATGPGIPHQEVFYGPAPASDKWRPIVLGPVTLLFGSRCVWLRDYRWKRAGIDVQAWPEAMVSHIEVPSEEGWAARFERIQVGMPRSEVERILGNPTNSTPPEVYYGHWHRGHLWSSVGSLGKILVEYSPDDTIARKQYFRDQVGYEAAPGFSVGTPEEPSR